MANSKNYRQLWKKVMFENSNVEDPLSVEALATANKIVQTWIRKYNLLWLLVPMKVELIRAIAHAIDAKRKEK